MKLLGIAAASTALVVVALVVSPGVANAAENKTSAAPHAAGPSGTPSVAPSGTPSVAPPRAPVSARLTIIARPTYQDANRDGRRDAGDTITVTYKVTNTGDVAVQNTAVSDPALARFGCRAGALPPNASTSCVGVQRISQGDMDRGSLRFGGTVTASTSDGRSVTVSSKPVIVPLNPSAKLGAAQSFALSSGRSNARAGDGLIYSVTVMNTGTVTLAGIKVTDSLLARAGLAVICPTTRLAPGAWTICRSGSFIVTKRQAGAGYAENFATASGVTPTGVTVHSGTTSTAVPVRPLPAKLVPRLAVQQWLSGVIDRNYNQKLDFGDGVTYSYRVVNTGALDLRSIVLHDAGLEADGVSTSCESTQLAPGQMTTCVSSPWKMSRFQAKFGVGTNYAHATGATLDGRVVRSAGSQSTHGLSLTPDSVPPAAASTSPSDALAMTGWDSEPTLFAASWLILVGCGLTLLGRRTSGS